MAPMTSIERRLWDPPAPARVAGFPLAYWPADVGEKALEHELIGDRLTRLHDKVTEA